MPTKKSTKTRSSKLKTSTQKAAASKTTTQKNSFSRQLKHPRYKSFRASRRIKHPSPKLPSAGRLFWRSLVNLKDHWKVFLGILLVYVILTLILVKGFSMGGNLLEAKQTLQSLSQASTNVLTTGLSLFGVLLGTSGASSDVASAYQSMLLIIMSLTIIWALRQTQAGVKIRIRDAFYKGVYPLVPLLIVLIVIGLQTIPLLAANVLYAIVFGNGIAITVLEQALWIMLFFLLSVFTLYLVTSSLFALYIVTLPDMEPMQALRSARELVRFRRWTVMRKLLFLPFILLVIGIVIFVPMVLYLTIVAEWVYFFLSILTLIVVHSYIYTVYRELLV